MKYLTILFTFCAFLFTTGMQAQNEMSNADQAKMETAVAAAEADENIEYKSCAFSGTTKFYRKDVHEATGEIALTPVYYDSSTEKWINLNEFGSAKASKKECSSKASASGKKACCAKSHAKACCAKKGKKSCDKDKAEAKVELKAKDRSENPSKT